MHTHTHAIKTPPKHYVQSPGGCPKGTTPTFMRPVNDTNQDVAAVPSTRWMAQAMGAGVQYALLCSPAWSHSNSHSRGRCLAAATARRSRHRRSRPAPAAASQCLTLQPPSSCPRRSSCLTRAAAAASAWRHRRSCTSHLPPPQPLPPQLPRTRRWSHHRHSRSSALTPHNARGAPLKLPLTLLCRPWPRPPAPPP
jgi:hypothetical protein